MARSCRQRMAELILAARHIIWTVSQQRTAIHTAPPVKQTYNPQWSAESGSYCNSAGVLSRQGTSQDAGLTQHCNVRELSQYLDCTDLRAL